MIGENCSRKRVGTYQMIVAESRGQFWMPKCVNIGLSVHRECVVVSPWGASTCMVLSHTVRFTHGVLTCTCNRYGITGDGCDVTTCHPWCHLSPSLAKGF